MDTFNFPTAADIEAAAERIAPYVPETPVMTSTILNDAAGADLHFKMENLMPELGSFKIRGALNAVLSLTPEERALGVMTQSSGNHGAALAKAASIVGIPCQVVVPDNAPEFKKELMRSFGAKLHGCGRKEQNRKDAAEKLRIDTGMTMVHPFNDLRVIAGQATAARELLRQVPGLDALFVPVGGGGLISGAALAARYDSPQTRVIGGEPDGAPDAALSLSTGQLQENKDVSTIADGLRSSLGDKTFPIIKAFVEHIELVTDEDILKSMRQLWIQLRTIIEPSGVVSYSAFWSMKKKLRGKKIGVILSGGNVQMKWMSERLWGGA